MFAGSAEGLMFAGITGLVFEGSTIVENATVELAVTRRKRSNFFIIKLLNVRRYGSNAKVNVSRKIVLTKT